MKHPSSFYFEEIIYQKHSKPEEGEKMLHGSKQIVTPRALLENSITFLLCPQSVQGHPYTVIL